MNDPVYLSGHTKLEPLSNGWYAWCHLLSPVQHALNIAFRYIPACESFMANAAVHERSARNPKMLGGAFMALSESDVPAIERLLGRTRDTQAPLIELAGALMQLDRDLQRESGFSLDHWYQRLPAPLAGMVEVGYDTHSHPTVRVLEELAQHSELADQRSQQLSLCAINDTQRPFFLSTPRLASEQRMILPIAFADERVDLLARARVQAIPFASFAQSLGVPPGEQPQLRRYFSTEPPLRKQVNYDGSAVRVRYFGHASVLLQTDAVAIMIDPFVTWDSYESDTHLSFTDLPDHIDYVFLTHNHQDHFSVELLLQLRSRIGTVLVPRNNPNNTADPSMRLALRGLGFEDVRVMDWMDSIQVPDGVLTSVPFYGEHADLTITSKHAMHVRLKERTFLFVADSDCKDRALYKRLAQFLGPVETLFIGMECAGAPLSWLYGCYLSAPVNRKNDGSRRLSGSNSARAAALVAELGCNNIFVYAMGQELWMQFVTGLRYSPDSTQIVESDHFIEKCRAAGRSARRLDGCNTFIF